MPLMITTIKEHGNYDEEIDNNSQSFFVCLCVCETFTPQNPCDDDDNNNNGNL